jgi:uncharacterized protein YjeT (DUF2065 family)
MTMADSHNAVQRLMLKYPRPAGAILVLLGAAFCYWMIIQPIHQADAGKPEIEISLTGGTVGVILTVIGLVYVVFGARFARIFQPSAEESKAPAYTAGVLLAIVGIGIYFALKSYLESKGYVGRR